MSSPTRILIITAAFGEGHNSAARNLGLALDDAGVQHRVADPCLLAAPWLTGWINRGYRYVTNHFPNVWAAFYRSTDRSDLSTQYIATLQIAENALEDLIDDYKPDAVVSTYPLYPYFMTRIQQRTGSKLPVFVVVTDSIEINAAWLRAKCDFWLVTDPATRDAMVAKGLAWEQIIDTGFPVNPVFSRLTPMTSDEGCNPFRILYFPVANAPLLGRHARALLEAAPTVQLTIVLGRNVRQLYAAAREMKNVHPGRVRIVGWTRRVPQFLNNHHLVVGKAGGATVHEAIAACCPMLIHHLVPGQEEGNLRLLETIGCGQLADRPEVLRETVVGLLAGNAVRWREMKRALVRHGRNAGAITAADFIIKKLENQ